MRKTKAMREMRLIHVESPRTNRTTITIVCITTHRGGYNEANEIYMRKCLGLWDLNGQKCVPGKVVWSLLSPQYIKVNPKFAQILERTLCKKLRLKLAKVRRKRIKLANAPKPKRKVHRIKC